MYYNINITQTGEKRMLKPYQGKIKDIYTTTESSINGLSSVEASNRLEKNGYNTLKENAKRSAIKIFLSQLNNLMIILLILAGAVSLVYAITSNQSFIESIVIFGCVAINILMGFFQELKSENAIDSLRTLTISKVQTKRDNAWTELDASQLVVGDIILLESGDKVPADARIINNYGVQVDESILTGESLAVEKNTLTISGDALLQDRKNMLFSGTIIVKGRVEAIVVSTGMDTEIGAIANTITKKQDKLTPLQIKVKKVSAFITILSSILIAAALCYGLIKKMDVISIIMLCISMVLASVPEVLPVSITATLTIGVKQMSKKRTIVKQLSAIETLGATQIICSDKTGTITTNEMTLVEIFCNDKTYKNIKTQNPNLSTLNNILALCNDSERTVDKDIPFIGDPVEIALSKYLLNLNINIDEIRNKFKRIGEIAFDSNRKMMSTINKDDKNTIINCKGSLEQILSKCSKYIKNGKIYNLNSFTKQKFLQKEKNMSKRSYKVLAFAYKEIDEKITYSSDDESNLILVGIVGMMDPPKDGVKNAVAKCLSSKIKPIMITGDSLTTAMAIAKEIGIAKKDSQGIEGQYIENLSDDELKNLVKKYTVFARVNPNHKVRIVRAFQQNNKVVAMTGDGVNDAPAIKLAHVGIGMGKAGTDVTKNVADIILMDDSFSTIVTAVEEGRRIYSNVLKTILYNLSSNFAEIFLILAGMIYGIDLITAIHILYIDIVADTIPSIALAFEKNTKDAMRQKPYGLNKSIFTPFMNAGIIGSALIEAAISISVFFVAKSLYGLQIAQSLALLSVVFTELTFAYNCKELKSSVFKKGLFKNNVLNFSILAIFLIQILVFFTPIGSIFGLAKITILQFISVLAINIIGFLIIELLKPLWVKFFKD